MQISKLLVLVVALTCTSLAFADEVPVVDGYAQSDSSTTTTSTPASAANNDASNAAYSDNSNPAVTSAVPANATAPAVSSLPLAQRVTVLERQVNNLTQLVQQMNSLQQQVQTLSGQLDVEKHNLKTLQDQMRSQYADLDQRLSARAPKTATIANVNNQAATPATTDNDATSNNVQAAANTDQSAYQAAFALLKNKQYPQATAAFRKFIKQYPTSTNTVNAYYWLGQLYLLQGLPNKAIAQFQYIIKQHANDPKVPDTMVQLGLAYYAKGSTKLAVDELKKVQLQYPNTAAANLAKSRLQKIQQFNQANAAASADSSGDDS